MRCPLCGSRLPMCPLLGYPRIDLATSDGAAAQGRLEELLPDGEMEAFNSKSIGRRALDPSPPVPDVIECELKLERMRVRAAERAPVTGLHRSHSNPATWEKSHHVITQHRHRGLGNPSS